MVLPGASTGRYISLSRLVLKAGPSTHVSGSAFCMDIDSCWKFA